MPPDPVGWRDRSRGQPPDRRLGLDRQRRAACSAQCSVDPRPCDLNGSEFLLEGLVTRMTKPTHRLGVELDEIVRVLIHTLPRAIGPRLVSSCPASTFTLQHFFLTAFALTASGDRRYTRKQLWGRVGRGGLGVSSGGESRPGEWDVSGELRAR